MAENVRELVAEVRKRFFMARNEYERGQPVKECSANELVNRLADALENMEALLREARDSGYLKQKVTSNETGLGERVDTALDAARKEAGR